MPKFTFSCKVTVSAVTEVEADTVEAAMEAAKERSARIDTSWKPSFADDWVITEADGEPTDFEVQG